MPLRAVIFDCDGVLIDSEPVHLAAFREVLAPLGIEIGDDDYRRRYLGIPDRAAFAVAMADHPRGVDPSTLATLMRAKAEVMARRLPQARLQPGIVDLIRDLEGVPLAVASGALRAEVLTVVAMTGLAARFSAVVGAEDVTRGKPDPEPFECARRRLEREVPALAPSDCVVIEDAVTGLVGASRAGMRAIAVATSFAPEELRPAALVVRSLAALSRARLEALYGP